MDATSDGVPPVPRQSRHESQSRRRGVNPSLHLRIDRNEEAGRVNIPPASPEIISSLITSLDVISKRASNHFENQSLSVPSPSSASSPRNGSFGIEYGGFSQPPLDRLQEEDIDLNELAASPPTIRTAKPPSGFSALTAPKTPRSPREPGSSLKSLLRSSRPSSRSSASSSRDDAHSIGNLSIERGLAPAPELRRRRSSDSWGKKQARSQMGLMYMSSKERLRATDAEKKRHSSGGIAGAPSSRTNSLLVETPINEEEPQTKGNASSIMSPSSDPGSNLQHGGIPARDSSLRKTGSNAKRSSHRSSRTTRESDIIHENEEHGRSRESTTSKRRQPSRAKSEADTRKRREDILTAEMPNFSKPNRGGRMSRYDSHLTKENAVTPIDPDEDGAPFPSVYSSRRRSAHSADRAKTGRTTPDPGDPIRLKRSSSRLKRLSNGVLSPDPAADRKKNSATPEPTVGYERPMSADSVDDAVESYLCSPRLSQKIRHPQTGRVISFSEVGDSEGSAVFCCVGMGLTRYITAFYDELALTLKLRLITPDRPGVGDSEPYADGTATPLSWPGKYTRYAQQSIVVTTANDS